MPTQPDLPERSNLESNSARPVALFLLTRAEARVLHQAVQLSLEGPGALSSQRSRTLLRRLRLRIWKLREQWWVEPELFASWMRPRDASGRFLPLVGSGARAGPLPDDRSDLTRLELDNLDLPL